MRRTVGLIVVLSVSLLLVLSMFWALSAFGGAPIRPDWEAPMLRYLATISAGKPIPYTVASATRADRPWALDAADAGVTFSSSHHFITDRRYDDTPSSGLPLPYPPNDVWCVEYGAYGERDLALVAQHEALYNADWVVHEMGVDPASGTGRGLLQKLGCRFGSN